MTFIPVSVEITPESASYTAASIALAKAAEAKESQLAAKASELIVVAAESIVVADAAQVALDRVQTGLDATTATTKAGEAAASELIALASKEAAETAQGLSEGARDASIAAKDLAVTAKTAAETAETNAETAQGLSEGARDASIAAKELAVTAKTNAETAETNTETAQGLSEDARDASIAAKDLAVTAKLGAETAQGLSEDARDASIAAKDLAVTAETNAETAQGLSEGARDASIAAKDLAVTAKTNAETAETNAETAYANTQTLLTNFFDPTIMALSSRSTTDGATILKKLHNLQSYLDTLYNTVGLIEANQKLIWFADNPAIVRTDGVLKYYREGLETYNLADLDGSATATAQPRLVGGIAPNSKFAASNQNGEVRYFTHPPISFAANEAWSVTIRLKWEGSGLGYDNPIAGDISTATSAIWVRRTTNRIAFTNTLGTSVGSADGSSNAYIAKFTTIQYVADGNGNLKIYVNGLLLSEHSVITSAIFNALFVGRLTPISTYSLKANINYYHIQSGAMTAAQVLSEATFLRTLYPEIESTVIGTQEWATRNFEAVYTPMGNVIPEMQTAAAVEKLTGWDFTSGWSASGSTINNATQFTLNATNGDIRKSYLTVGKWYKLNIVGTATAGSFRVDNPNPLFAYGTTSVNTTIVFKAANANIYIVGQTSGAQITVSTLSVQELGWSNSTEIYDAVYAVTAGTAAQKHYAACKEAGMWCYYNNDAANGAIYGKLYNWHAVSLLDLDMASASFGWRIPTQTDWLAVQAFYGGSAVVGGKLKMTGLDYWNAPNTGATNENGFTALPGAKRDDAGAFAGLNASGQFYGSTEGYRYYVLASSAVGCQDIIDKKNGLSLRLIK